MIHVGFAQTPLVPISAQAVKMWTRPADRAASFGPRGQAVEKLHFPTACPHSPLSRPHPHRFNSNPLVKEDKARSVAAKVPGGSDASDTPLTEILRPSGSRTGALSRGVCLNQVRGRVRRTLLPFDAGADAVLRRVCWWRPKSAEKWRTQDMGVDFLDRRVLAKRVVDGRKPASGHESQLRQGVASGHPQGRSAAKEPQSGLTRRNPLTFDPTCCGFSHSLFAIYARCYAAVNTCSPLGCCGRGIRHRRLVHSAGAKQSGTCERRCSRLCSNRYRSPAACNRSALSRCWTGPPPRSTGWTVLLSSPASPRAKLCPISRNPGGHDGPDDADAPADALPRPGADCCGAFAWAQSRRARHPVVTALEAPTD